ncbi:hypothetical protein NM208_g308 [Fusarium decemcellulare]|uniref:Uncharacterized protein n=1 Tax=Fusarium decemcellulare TaxID=57161 RepID=A0ACC1SZT5_9HYPO|nr:hypothetical protein NM208_g308 [Fusarium decemcellulare]
MAVPAITQCSIVLGLALVLLLVDRAFRRPDIPRNGQRLRKAPGTLPIVGNGLVFLRPRQELFSWFTKCVQQYGHETIAINIPTLPSGVIISDPINLAHVFQHQEIFQKGDFFRSRLHDLFGYGIVNVDGHLWKRQRKAGTQFFNAGTLKNLTNVDLPKILHDTVARLGSAGQPVDLEAVIHEATTQLMGRLAYGVEMHAEDEFTQAFDYASSEIAKRFQNPLWRWTELITGMRLRKSVSQMKAYGQKLVQDAVTRRGCADDKRPNLINILLDHLGNNELVADSALNYLSAGKDTIAQALTWTFYLLSKHNDVSDRVYDLVKSTRAVIKHDDLTPAASNFILAVFYEALRLYPPIPFELKQAKEDTTLPDGTFIPQDSVVLWCTWAMNRSTQTWGSDAELYRPDRWLHEGVMTQKSAAEFPVFQGGARLCLGKKMAEVIAIQTIATLTNAFTFSPAFEGEKTSRTHLTLPMEGGLQLLVERRQLC